MDKIGVGYASVTDLEKTYVMDALDNGRLSQGKYVARFEKEFAEIHGQRYGVMCNSGTTALQLALETYKELYGWNGRTSWSPCDDENGGRGSIAEVLCPAITFIATSNACLHAGLNVKFVDVDPVTYNMNPDEIERHITKNTKCIIPVHAFGMPCDMSRIMKIAEKYDLKVLEDCAEAHFATVDEKRIGSFGEMSAFSTYVAHTITTGVGGIICTSNRKAMEILRSLVAHGRACTCEVCKASDAKEVCPARMSTEIDRRFMFVRMGYSYRIGEIEGALGVAQLERRDEIMNARKRNAQYLIDGLSEFNDLIQLPTHPSNIEHTYMMFPILLKSERAQYKEVIRYLEDNNIETRPMLPLLNQPIYRKIFGDIEKDYPVAQYINRHGFYIGCHHGLKDDDLDRIIQCFKKYFRNI